MIDVPDVAAVPPLDYDNIELTLRAVQAEVCRQDLMARSGRFGGTHVMATGPDEARLGVLTEEVGEVARALNEALILRSLDRDHLVVELIQVAACAVSWATALEGGLTYPVAEKEPREGLFIQGVGMVQKTGGVS